MYLSVGYGRLDVLADEYSVRFCVAEKESDLHVFFRSGLAMIRPFLYLAICDSDSLKFDFLTFKSIRVFNHSRQFTAKLKSPTKVTLK
jgi:hypothetical protein